MPVIPRTAFLLLALAFTSHCAGKADTATGLDGLGANGPSATTAACIEKTTYSDGTTASTSRIIYTRKAWDASSRILTSESSSAADFSNLSTLKWRYADEGRVIAYIGVEQPFQHDYRYDEHKNVVDFRLSYPAAPDLMTPSTASTWIGTSYQNEYDTQGRLAASTVGDYGAGASAGAPSRKVFHEDSLGRCDVVETTTGTVVRRETRTYDGAGRLVGINVTVTGSTQYTYCPNDATTFTYDDQGRLTSESWSCGQTTSTSPGDSGTIYTYGADGSHQARRSSNTDVISERVAVTERPAACLAIDAAIGSPSDSRCRLP